MRALPGLTLGTPMSTTQTQQIQKNWFETGQTCGRYQIISARAHGRLAQRYHANDPTIDRPVLITCAKPDPTTWTSRFKELASLRADIPVAPRLLDWGITDTNIFYMVEEDLHGTPMAGFDLGRENAPPEKRLLASYVAGISLLYALAEFLSDLASLGFFHGALDFTEHCKLYMGEPLLEGVGFLQILGCSQEADPSEGAHLAPEVRAGRPGSERADVFAVCSFILSLIRGETSEAEAWTLLEDLGEPFRQGLLEDPEQRPGWEALLGPIKKILGPLVFTTGAQAGRMIEAINNIQTQAPTTPPRSPRTDAIVRAEVSSTFREMFGDGMEAKPHQLWIWKEYPRLQPPIPTQAPSRADGARSGLGGMDSGEGEPSTKRSAQLHGRRHGRRVAAFGMAAALSALAVFGGLWMQRIAEPARVLGMQGVRELPPTPMTVGERDTKSVETVPRARAEAGREVASRGRAPRVKRVGCAIGYCLEPGKTRLARE